MKIFYNKYVFNETVKSFLVEKPLLIAILLASMIGCTSPNLESVDSRGNISSLDQGNAKANDLKLIGNTFYFLNDPPDKLKPQDFKDQKAIDAHYAILLEALKQRNPIQDARFAFEHGMRHFLTYNGLSVVEDYNARVSWGLGNPEMEKRCPGSLTDFRRFEGVAFYENSRECLNNSSTCRGYVSTVNDAYLVPWNREMARLCWGGKLPH